MLARLAGKRVPRVEAIDVGLVVRDSAGKAAIDNAQVRFRI